MKEYNIYVKTPPIGNVIIYMLTHYGFLHPEELGILLNAAAIESAKKYLKISPSIQISPNVSQTHVQKYLRADFPMEIDADILVATLIKTIVPQENRIGFEEQADARLIRFFETDANQIEIGAESNAVAHTQKYIICVNETQISVQGVSSDSLTTSSADEILTRTGEEIETVTFKDTIDAHLTKSFFPEDTPIYVDAGGIAYGFLETRDGEWVSTRDGIEIEAVQVVSELPIYQTKTLFLDRADPICVDADATITEIKTTLPSPSYIGVQNAIGETAMLRTSETVDSEIGISASDDVSIHQTKSFFPEDAPIHVDTDQILLLYRKVIEAEPGAVCIDASAVFTYMRLRELGELDDFELGDIDDMTLRTLDYVET